MKLFATFTNRYTPKTSNTLLPKQLLSTRATTGVKFPSYAYFIEPTLSKKSNFISPPLINNDRSGGFLESSFKLNGAWSRQVIVFLSEQNLQTPEPQQLLNQGVQKIVLVGLYCGHQSKQQMLNLILHLKNQNKNLDINGLLITENSNKQFDFHQALIPYLGRFTNQLDMVYMNRHNFKNQTELKLITSLFTMGLLNRVEMTSSNLLTDLNQNLNQDKTLSQLTSQIWEKVMLAINTNPAKYPALNNYIRTNDQLSFKQHPNPIHINDYMNLLLDTLYSYNVNISAIRNKTTIPPEALYSYFCQKVPEYFLGLKESSIEYIEIKQAIADTLLKESHFTFFTTSISIITQSIPPSPLTLNDCYL